MKVVTARENFHRVVFLKLLQTDGADSIFGIQNHVAKLVTTLWSSSVLLLLQLSNVQLRCASCVALMHDDG